tara:strand:- start:3226 stop:4872 length:1647 start_codon:yes stop_codon:yes gene_type:complete
MADWYPKRTFGDLPREAAARWPDREALVFEETRLTFAELDAEIDRATRGLMAAGVQRGDHVCLWLNNCAEWIYLMFGLARAGAVQIPVNTRFRTHDLEYVLRQSDSRFLITHDTSGPIDYLDMVREMVTLPSEGNAIADDRFPELNGVIIVAEETHAGTADWRDALAAGDSVSAAELETRIEAVDPADPVFIMYTSGTTGFPKGVVHNHTLVRNTEERGFRMAITPRDVILNYLPLFHAFGYSEGALMSVATGAKQILTETFDPQECLDLIEREGVSLMHGFEAHLKGLSEGQQARPRDLSSLRTGIFAAGMHSATPVARRGAQALAPMQTISGFGMTEIWLGAALGSLDDDLERRTETSGFPGLGYEVRVVDTETGVEVAPGDTGEIQVRGYSLMQGYYKKPAETAASYTADGWFRTGDSGLIREDGYLRFLGRYKDMLKVGGENVDPMEVEGLLLEQDGIAQVAVVALPDQRLSEVAVAYVQPSPGATLTETDVIGFCRGKVASFKIPRHVLFIDEFPMTASGKIRKVELREDAATRLGPASAAGD